MEQAYEKLKSKKLKITRQRLAIYVTLAHTDRHPSAETIYNSIRHEHPSMSLATVYKNLSLLTDAELIQELNVGDGSFRYDAHAEPHPHIICMGCGEVYDLPETPSMGTLKEELAAQSDFLIMFEKLFFYGLCPLCRSESI